MTDSVVTLSPSTSAAGTGEFGYRWNRWPLLLPGTAFTLLGALNNPNSLSISLAVLLCLAWFPVLFAVWYDRLIVRPEGLSWRSVFGKRHLKFEEVDQVRWPPFLFGSDLRLIAGTRSETILLNYLESDEARASVVTALRQGCPETIQHGWEGFARRLPPDLGRVGAGTVSEIERRRTDAAGE